MSWEILIGLFMLMTACSAIFDALLKEESIHRTQTLVADWQKQLVEKNYSDLIKESNKYINIIFNKFYGDNHISKRAIFRSSLSSIFSLTHFMIIFVIFCDNYDQYFYKLFKGDEILYELIILVVFNLIADYVSLTETRIILKISGRYPMLLPFLLILDLLLTFICYSLIGGIMFVLIYKGKFSINTVYLLFKTMWTCRLGSPFVWSTFFTSMLFYAFISCSIIIKCRTPMDKILGWYVNSKNPIKSFTVLFGALVFIFEGLKRLF